MKSIHNAKRETPEAFEKPESAWDEIKTLAEIKSKKPPEKTEDDK